LWTISPSYPQSARTALWTLYTLLDLSGLSDRLIGFAVVAGLLSAAVIVVAAIVRRRRLTGAIADVARVALPFGAPVVLIAAGVVIAWLTRKGGFPVQAPGAIGGLIRSDDFTGLGALGGLVLLVAPVVTAVLYAAGRVDVRHLVLATAMPTFLILFSLHARF